MPDTSPEAEKLQWELYERMAPAQRLKAALDLSDITRKLTLAGLETRMPGATARELIRALIEICYPRIVVERILVGR